MTHFQLSSFLCAFALIFFTCTADAETGAQWLSARPELSFCIQRGYSFPREQTTTSPLDIEAQIRFLLTRDFCTAAPDIEAYLRRRGLWHEGDSLPPARSDRSANGARAFSENFLSESEVQRRFGFSTEALTSRSIARRNEVRTACCRTRPTPCSAYFNENLSIIDCQGLPAGQARTHCLRSGSHFSAEGAMENRLNEIFREYGVSDRNYPSPSINGVSLASLPTPTGAFYLNLDTVANLNHFDYVSRHEWGHACEEIIFYDMLRFSREIELTDLLALRYHIPRAAPYPDQDEGEGCQVTAQRMQGWRKFARRVGMHSDVLQCLTGLANLQGPLFVPGSRCARPCGMRVIYEAFADFLTLKASNYTETIARSFCANGRDSEHALGAHLVDCFLKDPNVHRRFDAR